MEGVTPQAVAAYGVGVQCMEGSSLMVVLVHGRGVYVIKVAVPTYIAGVGAVCVRRMHTMQVWSGVYRGAKTVGLISSGTCGQHRFVVGAGGTARNSVAPVHVWYLGVGGTGGT